MSAPIGVTNHERIHQRGRRRTERVATVSGCNSGNPGRPGLDAIERKGLATVRLFF